MNEDPIAVADRSGRSDVRVFAGLVAPGILRLCLTPAAPPHSSAIVSQEIVAKPCVEVSTDDVELGDAVVRLRADGPSDGIDGPDAETTAVDSPRPPRPFLTVDVPGATDLLRLTSATLKPIDLVRYDTNGEPADVETIRTVDGERVVIRNLMAHPDGEAYQAELRLLPALDEGLYGLGQEEGIGYQRRGTKTYLYQHNMRIPMPVLVSDHGYGLLFDCASLMTYDGTGDEQVIGMNAVEALDFYVIIGGAHEVVAGLRRLTGKATLPPKWAFGYIQSKERYATSAELVDVARQYRRSGVPLDGVVQDWKTWPGEQWGQKTVDRERYPDLMAFKAEMEALDVHTMVSVWPNMALHCPDHDEFAAAGLLLADYSTYDAFAPAGRDLYWTQLSRELSPAFDSWWCDSTEPFSAPDWQGVRKLPEDQRFRLVGREHERYLGARRANLYALEHARGIYEHERAEQARGGPVRRVLNLTRSGYPGSQRYGAVLWSGDVSATWGDLQAEITKVITMGLCGVPWWTTDAGGFFAGGTACWRRWCDDPTAEPVWFWRGDYDGGVADLGYRELYTRWLQFAALLPMFRSHGTDTPREIWNFGEPGDPFYDAIASVIRLRYQLLPYVYSVAAKAALQDEVMVRGLLFDFVDDPRARVISDEFMLGDALLVAPVTKPCFFAPGSTPIDVTPERECYLPAGTKWWDWWAGQCHTGGQTVTVPAPLGTSPLFVRAGSVVVTQEPVSHAMENCDRFTVNVFSGADGGGQLYDDDGLTYRYEDGEYSYVEFDWDDTARRLTIQASSWVRQEPMTLRVRVDGQVQTLTYDGQPATITVEERP